jgi:ribonucleoside-diphosphate reductase alpha chain
MQAAFQEYTDNAVSKTINLQGNSKREDVAHIYIRAYEKGLKGITIFRYGSKMGTMVKFTDVD